MCPQTPWYRSQSRRTRAKLSSLNLDSGLNWTVSITSLSWRPHWPTSNNIDFFYLRNWLHFHRPIKCKYICSFLPQKIVLNDSLKFLQSEIILLVIYCWAEWQLFEQWSTCYIVYTRYNRRADRAGPTIVTTGRDDDAPCRPIHYMR